MTRNKPSVHIGNTVSFESETDRPEEVHRNFSALDSQISMGQICEWKYK
jgi:hypothetical protein